MAETFHPSVTVLTVQFCFELIIILKPHAFLIVHIVKNK